MAKNPYSKENMRAALAEMNAANADLEAELAPLQEEIAAMVKAHAEAEAPLRAKLKALQSRKYELDVQRGPLSKALGGFSMSDADVDGEAPEA